MSMLAVISATRYLQEFLARQNRRGQIFYNMCNRTTRWTQNWILPYALAVSISTLSPVADSAARHNAARCLVSWSFYANRIASATTSGRARRPRRGPTDSSRRAVQLDNNIPPKVKLSNSFRSPTARVPINRRCTTTTADSGTLGCSTSFSTCPILRGQSILSQDVDLHPHPRGWWLHLPPMGGAHSTVLISCQRDRPDDLRSASRGGVT